ncbi:urea ABC transporter permease subunit UrtB [Shimwellia pseudoproteus]|uniref:urea ABC transporter permease subunit UrtB n=1 Tax=Shimwellia pseudoproteus TaxID=570012 RepID=UPI0018EB362F|nr:urea ABC transporter permease subunit UrtB [Shimwellia pseudoproteus]
MTPVLLARWALLTRWIALLCCLCPLLARAAATDADTFVAASRSQQATLLQQWATAPDATRLPLLTALSDENVAIDARHHAFSVAEGVPHALGAGGTPQGDLHSLRLTNRLRTLVATALACHQLGSADVSERRQGAAALMRDAQADQLPLLQSRLGQETDPQVRTRLSRALARLNVHNPDEQVRLRAVDTLGSAADPEAVGLLMPLTQPASEPSAAVREAASASLKAIKYRLLAGDLAGQVFMGLSLGSVLLLAALGLAITYGLLGVINMAHGEMLMLGAYATWLVQNLFQQFAPHYLAWYPLLALPVAFLLTAMIGMALERTVIRHLYGRPLETLLATWGISLILIQGVRMLFGPQNLEVANPAWLSGGWQVLPNLMLPWNRIVVLGFVLVVLGFTWLLLNKTRLGLNIRAVTQNRAMAASCGVPTGQVDMLAFGLGSGIAGLGGVALSQMGNVGPELGQGYIIDSFLVVVLGGVGQLAGCVAAAFGLGMFNKILEPWIGAVPGKILILGLIILLIQKRPQGLFALKGRVTE